MSYNLWPSDPAFSADKAIRLLCIDHPQWPVATVNLDYFGVFNYQKRTISLITLKI